jgi:hypothetical protein
MEICKSGHAEICHDEWGCPICEQIEKLQDEIKELEDKIEELKVE